MDIKKIEDQLKKVPEEIKKHFFSIDAAQKISRIGEKHELLIDQIDILIEETGYVMIGLKPAENFVNSLVGNLRIKKDVAYKIAEEINAEVLDTIKESIRKIEELENNGEVGDSPKSIPLSTPPPISPNTLNLSNEKLEKAGGFTIENRPPSNSPMYNDSLLTKEDVLKEVEEVDEIVGIKKGVSFVDHLLSSPVSSPQQTESVREEPKEEIKKSEPAKYTVDPYREQI